MITQLIKNEKRLAVHKRIRRKIAGSPERPRMCVFRSLKHFYVQVIDDRTGCVLVSASTNEKTLRPKIGNGGNIAAAKEIGKVVAEKAAAKGIHAVVMDRGGYLYHGRILAFAEAAREAGLQF
jgi:large subunit ribosomal protein L18